MCEVTPVLKQFLAIFFCNLLTLSNGWSGGFATINYVDLQNENTTYPTGPLTSDELAIVMSISSVGGFIGNFAIVPISRWFGIKRTIHLLGVPTILSALLTIYATNVYFLCASSILGGFVNGGLIVSTPMFINEISNDNVRGTLNSIYDPSYNAGCIISFFLGNHLDILDQAKTQLIMPTIFIIVMMLLPDSPEHWIKNNRKELAHKSQTFYKGPIITSPEQIDFIPKDENIEMGKLAKLQDEQESKLSLRNFLTPLAKKSFCISFSALFLSSSSFTLVMFMYVTDIFSKTNSSLSEKDSSLLVSIVQIIANLVLLNIIDRLPRTTLYISSSILTAIGFFLYASYCLFLSNDPTSQWMSPFCFACIVFFSYIGLVPIPYILPTEIFEKKIRETCLAIVVSTTWIIFFFQGLLFPKLLQWLDLPLCFTLLGTMCLLNALLGYFYVPETMGKSHDEIMKLLKK